MAVPPSSDEIVEILEETPHVRIERITSSGHRSPPGFWYDQEEHEWVMLLSGEAGLRLADESEPRCLKPGDSLSIPAHCKHRVEWTSVHEPTVWLAVFSRDV